MCGIAGIIDFRGQPIDRNLLERFCASMACRGPDEHGIWTSTAHRVTVGLAHTRLAVIDPTPEGHQPMLAPNGAHALAYNGELYNDASLRGELGGSFTTRCDTETVLHACMRWGPDAVQRLDAMFALAFVDAAGPGGFLARDRFGIKPLYYAHHHDRLIFASEMNTLLLADVPREIDADALNLYLLVGYIPHPFTIYRHVRKLAPGHLLTWDEAGPAAPRRYHHIAPDTDAATLSFRDAAAKLRHLIESAVERQCVADVPLGAFLSGGLDSSAIVAAMARRGTSRIKTFSIGYADHPRYDETTYAEQVAACFGTEHHAFQLTFSDILHTVEPMLARLGEPFADSSLLPTALISRHTREHVTVALSGDGGDELFGGYWRYIGQHHHRRYQRLPAILRRGVIEPLLKLLPTARSTPLLSRVRQLKKLALTDATDPLGLHLAWARIIDPATAAGLLGADRASGGSRLLRDIYESGATDGMPSSAHEPHPTSSVAGAGQFDLARILAADLAVGLPGDMLHKVDIASMTHSLEVRVPLLSADVVSFACSLPLEHRISGTAGKRVLREAFRDLLPPPVLTRPKMGFEVPVGEFLRHELRDMYHDRVTPAALTSLGLNPATAAKLFDDHLHRRRDSAEILWALLVLCDWHQRQHP